MTIVLNDYKIALPSRGGETSLPEASMSNDWRDIVQSNIAVI